MLLALYEMLSRDRDGTTALLDVITRFAVQWATKWEFPWGTPNLADV